MAITTTSRGNPGPIGLIAFSFTTIFLSLVNSGILPAGGEALVIPMALLFGGTVQIIAGILEFQVGNTFGMTAFLSYGVFWWWDGLVYLLSHNGLLDVSKSGAAAGACLLLWSLLTACFMISSIRVSRALFSAFLTAALTFLFAGLGAALSSPMFSQWSGWVGLLTGICAGYTGVGLLTNEMYGREVLPLGHFNHAVSSSQ